LLVMDRSAMMRNGRYRQVMCVHATGAKRMRGWAAVFGIWVVHGCSNATTAPAPMSSGADCGQATVDAATESPTADGGCNILASDYDRSCRVDVDCSLIAQGDYCTPGCLCEGAAINVGALSQFYRAVGKAMPIGSDAMAQASGCTCLVPAGPCCRAGICQVGARCQVDGGSCQ